MLATPRRTISRAADTAAGGVEAFLLLAGEATSDPLESLGNALRDAVAPAARLPVAGAVLIWAMGIAPAVLDLGAVSIKAATDALAGVVGGLLRAIGGFLAVDAALARRGGWAVVDGVAGGVLMVSAEAVSLAQALLPFVQAAPRRLTPSESEALRRVFGSSLPLHNVRLYEGRSGLFGLNPRPFTLGNKLHLKRRDVRDEPSLLLHECVHVWQYRHEGARYAVQAIRAQWTLENAYDWRAEIERGPVPWRAWNREAQAELFEEVHDHGSTVDADGAPIALGSGVFFEADGSHAVARFARRGVDHTDVARAALDELRSRRSPRLSSVWS